MPGGASLDLAYDPSAPEDPARSLDVYAPLSGPDRSRVPVVVWVHGGGWFTGDKGNKIGDKVALFNGAGYVLVSVNYRLSPEPVAAPAADRIMYPTHPQDVARALAWVHDNIDDYGGDPERIAVLGHSAGAHLVALVGTAPAFLGAHGLAPANLRCVGSFDTEGYDVPNAIATSSTDQRTLLVNAFGEDPSVWEEASPIRHANAQVGDFLLVARGSPERIAGVNAFADSLTSLGVPVETIDAAALAHDEVNSRIGAAGDDVMTAPVMGFLARCFE